MAPTPTSHRHSGGPTDLLAHVRDDLGRAGIASQWLAVRVQSDPPDGRWLARDELLADGGREVGRLVDGMARARAGVDPRLVWRGIPASVAWPLGSTATALLETGDRVLRLDPSAVRLRLGGGDEPSIDGIWIERVALVVAPGDPLAGRGPEVRVADAHARREVVAADLVAFLAPVVALAASRARVGERGLWAAVVDCVLGGLAARRPADATPDAPRGRVAAFLSACVGTPLATVPRWTSFEHRGAPHATLRYCACCLAYRWPHDEERGPREDGADPRWDRYCLACPLIPDGEVVHRGRYWLDRAASG